MAKTLSAQERLSVLYNIIARAGGIENIDLHSELAKSLAAINGMNAQAMQNSSVSPVNQGAGGTISPDVAQSTPPAPQEPNPLQNTPNPNEGQGSLNLPQ